MGKTFQMLALVSTDKLQEASKTAPMFRSDPTAGGTLVVVPLSLLTQWVSELRTASGDRFTYFEYHGTERHKGEKAITHHDVVLTTYGTLHSDPTNSGLYTTKWRRIILDEAHAIKNRQSKVAKAAARLQARCRWCVTGTPMQNTVEELFPLLNFLRVEPWSAPSVWRKAVSEPLARGENMVAVTSVRKSIKDLMLRRTKTTRNRQAQLLIELPPKHVHVHELELSPAEQDFYDSLYLRSKTQFDDFVARGRALNNYTHILQLILRLRQALCHPLLTFAQGHQDKDLEAAEERFLRNARRTNGQTEDFVRARFAELKAGELSSCPICLEVPEDAIITQCGHVMCRACCEDALRRMGEHCPECRAPGVTKKTISAVPGRSKASLGAEASGIRFSTKMDSLASLLKEDLAAGRRAVVFSQWIGFLDLLQRMIEGMDAPVKRLDGSMGVAGRRDVVRWVQEPEGSGRVLLVSLKAGGTGLNLTAATRVYLMDLWWNPAVEDQAMQRVHRIGQTQDVHVFKFVVKNSMDERILDLQRSKGALISGALDGGELAEGAGKLNLDDLKALFR